MEFVDMPEVKNPTVENLEKFRELFQGKFEGGFKELGEYLDQMFSFDHDYQTIAEAFIFGLEASAKAMDNHKNGGVTGFQFGYIAYQFLAKTMHMEMFRILDFDKMLYPQYREEFHAINQDTWRWLQNKASRLLEDQHSANENVKAHWQSIVDGNVPFGYRVSK